MAEAFDRIVREYQDKIFRLAVSILENPGAAEEAAQEVLVRIWKGLGTFRGESSLSTWIYAITRNTCLTIATRRALPAVSLDELAPRREVERRAAADWTAAASPDVAALLETLPEKYRQVVTLFYMQEKSYEEVARMLDIPVGTVKTYLFRARKSLAEYMMRERMRKGGA